MGSQDHRRIIQGMEGFLSYDSMETEAQKDIKT
jgi:hypothetical protein